MKPEYLVRGTPGHPLHPPFTDATIGAYTFGTVAAVLSVLGIEEEPAAHGWWLALLVGLVFAAPTVLTGFVDYFSITRGTPLRRTATAHAVAQASANVAFLLAVVVGYGDYQDASVGAAALLLTLAGFGLLTLGGMWGGSIVFVHGMRVLNLVDEPATRALSPLAEPEKEQAERG